MTAPGPGPGVGVPSPHDRLRSELEAARIEFHALLGRDATRERAQLATLRREIGS